MVLQHPYPLTFGWGGTKYPCLELWHNMWTNAWWYGELKWMETLSEEAVLPFSFLPYFPVGSTPNETIPSKHMTLKWHCIDINVTSSCGIDIGTTSFQHCPLGLLHLEQDPFEMFSSSSTANRKSLWKKWQSNVPICHYVHHYIFHFISCKKWLSIHFCLG